MASWRASVRTSEFLTGTGNHLPIHGIASVWDLKKLCLSLLDGRLTLRFVDEHASDVASAAVTDFFQRTRSDVQALDALNSLLVFYGAKPITSAFFQRYLGVDCTKSTVSFLAGVRKFQAEAIRLFRHLLTRRIDA